MRILSTVTAFLLIFTAIFSQQSTAIVAELDCSEPVDIFFALDASDSLAPEEFNLEKDLVIQLLQRLIDANRDAKAGFLTFTTEINNVQDLQTNLAFTQFALRNVVFDREGTSLLAPLTFVFDNIFTSTNSNLRENSRKLFFLITDGEDQINTLMQLTDISRKLEERNVTIITMGIGTLLNTVQLSEIASMPHEQNLLIFSDLNEALGNVSSIIDRTCTIPVVNLESITLVSSTSMTITWTSYTFAAVSSYKICFTLEMRECNISQDADSALSSYTVGNLVPNTLYSVSVFASTDLGVTPTSNILQARTLEDLEIPIDLTATSVTSNSITLTWGMPTSGRASSMYEICFSSTSGGSCEVESTVSALIQPLEYVQENLEANTMYYIRIRGVESGVAGGYSTEITATTGISAEPTLLTVESLLFNLIQATWLDYGIGVSYEVCVRLSGANTCVQNVSVAAGTTTTFISGLEAFTSYDVSIVAITAQGRSQPSNTISLRTAANKPGAPASVNATAESATELIISWTETPIEQHFGVIVGYLVCIREVGAEACDFTVMHNAADMPFQVTQSGLEPNTTYRIRVRAINEAGSGVYTDNYLATTEPLRAVVLTAVSEGVTSIRLSWSAINVQSSSILNGILAVSKLPDGAVSYYTIGQADAISGAVTVQRFRPATNYYFILQLNTTVGITPESNQANAMTDEGEPSGAPTNFSAEAVSNTSVRLTWGEVEEHLRNGVITTYTICYGISENSCQNEIVNAPLLEYTINGLEPGTMYYFRIRASTAVGVGPSSDTISHITSIPVLVIVYIRADSYSSIDVMWENLQVTVTGYEIIIREYGSTDEVVISANSQSDVLTTSSIITGLEPYTLYYVIVRAVTPEGNINSTEMSVRTNETFPGSSVTNIIATAVNSSTITLSWDEVVEGDRNGVITEYDVCVEGAGGVCDSVVTVYAPNTQVRISGLTSETEYSLRIRAYTSAGAGPYSQQVFVTTLPLAPAEADVIITVENGPNVTIDGTFQQPGGPVSDVTVCVRVSGGTECVNVTIVFDNVMFTANPDELEPNTDYEVVITVVGPGGTTELDTMPFTTRPELPEGLVEIIESASRTTSIFLNWTEPAYPNDDSLTYFITISREGVVIGTIETTYIETTYTEIEISGLDTNTLYSITITPSNSVGNSTDVTTMTVATEQERPEPLEIVSVDGTNVVVRITPINPSNIPIDHYEVYVISTRGVRERTIIVNPDDNLTISIDGLTENTKYSFTVVAHVEDHTQAGISSPSQQSELVNVTIASIGAPNNPVTDLVVVINAPLIMNVSWNFDTTLEENLPTHFFVCLALTLDGNCTITRQVTADVTSVEITEVEELTVYYVRVYPENTFGFGPKAEVIVITPEAPPPPVFAIGTAISPYEILFEWEANSGLLNISYLTICLYNADMSMCEQTVDRQPFFSGAIVFSDLTPNTSYTISILELEYDVEEVTVVATTLLAAYLDSPLNVLVSAISSTILRVTWVASDDTLSSNLTAWEVCFEAERFIGTSGCVTSDKNELYKSIIGLEEYEYYTIVVRALYSNNTGTEFSVPVIGRTEQDVPSRPISELIDSDEDGIPKYFWKAPNLIHHNGIIVFYLVEFTYVENDLVKKIRIRADAITREVIIPSDVILPYNVAVTPYTIGAGPTYKLFGSEVEPQRAAAPCPDTRIAITILCVLFALLLILAIVMCCIILILAVKKRSSTYSAV